MLSTKRSGLGKETRYNNSMKETIAQFLNIKDFPFTIKNENGNEIYYENSNGAWIKKEFDLNGNRIYYEDSDGIVDDNRPKPVLEITLEEIAALKGVDVSQIRIKE
jgi:hypothetical protein